MEYKDYYEEEGDETPLITKEEFEKWDRERAAYKERQALIDDARSKVDEYHRLATASELHEFFQTHRLDGVMFMGSQDGSDYGGLTFTFDKGGKLAGEVFVCAVPADFNGGSIMEAIDACTKLVWIIEDFTPLNES